MSTQVDRAGIFRAVPKGWKVKRFEGKQSVAITIRFALVELLQDGQWYDVTSYDWHVFGDYFVIGKTGQLNQTAIDQVAGSIGWSGRFAEIESTSPPEVLVQVKVDAKEYQGKTSFQAGWINPGDYVPDFAKKDPEAVKDLDITFGSLMKAATAGKAPKPVGRPSPPPTTEPSDSAPF